MPTCACVESDGGALASPVVRDLNENPIEEIVLSRCLPASLRRGAACGAALLALAVVPAVTLANDQPITEAEKSLFLADHFRSVSGAKVLHYTLRGSGTLDKAFDDAVEVEISDLAGTRALETRCMTGSKKLELPPIENAKGNPALLCFLERDVREMERITGGKKWFFQKRIRLALADGPEVKPIKVNFAGKKIEAKEIRISPYAKDPLRARFDKYADKYYVFRLSDQVPGGILEIDAVIPDAAKPGGPKLVEDVMVFSRVEPSKKN